MATVFTTPHFAAATAAVAPAKSSFALPRLPVASSILFPVKFKPVTSKLFSIPISAKQPQKFNYPNPDPEFALAETNKFRMELVKKLLMEKGTYGNELDAVVDVCAEGSCDPGSCASVNSVFAAKRLRFAAPLNGLIFSAQVVAMFGYLTSFCIRNTEDPEHC